MEWDAIGALGELAGAVAVVFTLFYLALQMRQTQKTARAVAQRDLLLRVSEWARMSHTLENDGYDLFVSGMHEYETTDARTQARLETCLSEFVFITEAALNMRRDGFFSDGTWTGIIGGATALLRTPGGAQWWHYGQHYIGTEIVKYLKTELAKIDPETPSFLDFNASYRKRLAELAGVAES